MDTLNAGARCGATRHMFPVIDWASVSDREIVAYYLRDAYGMRDPFVMAELQKRVNMAIFVGMRSFELPIQTRDDILRDVWDVLLLKGALQRWLDNSKSEELFGYVYLAAFRFACSSVRRKNPYVELDNDLCHDDDALKHLLNPGIDRLVPMQLRLWGAEIVALRSRSGVPAGDRARFARRLAQVDASLKAGGRKQEMREIREKLKLNNDQMDGTTRGSLEERLAELRAQAGNPARKAEMTQMKTALRGQLSDREAERLENLGAAINILYYLLVQGRSLSGICEGPFQDDPAKEKRRQAIQCKHTLYDSRVQSILRDLLEESRLNWMVPPARK